MDIFERGTFIRRLEQVDESLRGKRIVLIVQTIWTVLIPIFLFIFFSGMDLPDWMKYFPILLFFMELGADFVVQLPFSRSMGPINLYSNGLEPPRAWIHILLGKHPFISKEKVTIVQSSVPFQKLSGGPYLTLSIKTKKGMLILFGVRRKEDVDATLEYATREWRIPVDRSFSMASMNNRAGQRPQGPPQPQIVHTAPLSNTDRSPSDNRPLLFCPNCGAKAMPEGDFCPMCGHGIGQPVARYMPPPHRVMAPLPPSPSPPSIIEEKSSLPSYLQKRPQLAFMLAFLPGLFCIMGLGHFYTKRVTKGIILLFVGFFAGLFAWVGLSMVFTETRFDTISYVLTAMIFWAIFLAILLWSAFDASREAKKYNAMPPANLLWTKDRN